MNKEQLLELIAGDQLEEALEAVRQLAVKSGRNDIRNAQVELSGRLNHYESRLRAGTDAPDDLERERNRIRKALRELTDDCFTPPARPDSLLRQQVSRWRWPLLIALLSLIAVGVGMLPAKEAPFEATLLSSDVAFRLEGDLMEPMEWGVWRCNLFQLSSIRGSGWNLEMTDEMPEPLEINIDSSEMSLKLISVPPNAGQHLRVRGNDFTITLLDGGAGELQTHTRANLLINPGGAARQLEAEGELLEWVADSGAELKFALPAGDASSLWKRTPVQSVKFEERLPGDTDARSAIISGKLTVGEQSEIQLEEGDYLDLEGLRDAALRIRPEGEHLRIDIKGYARKINSGLTTKRSHKPTLLEHLYQDQRISFIAGVLMSLISLLWTIRGALAKQS